MKHLPDPTAVERISVAHLGHADDHWLRSREEHLDYLSDALHDVQPAMRGLLGWLYRRRAESLQAQLEAEREQISAELQLRWEREEDHRRECETLGVVSLR